MTNEEMARGYLHRAQRVLGEAEAHFREKSWNLVVRRCQEAVELALKGVLRWLGLEIPRIHDVGALLKRESGRLSGRLAADVDRAASISRRLRQERELSFYGDEESDIPAEEIYTADDAAEALQDARFILELCSDQIKIEPF